MNTANYHSIEIAAGRNRQFQHQLLQQAGLRLPAPANIEETELADLRQQLAELQQTVELLTRQLETQNEPVGL
ncbi:hypothetical protein [Victivallis sp. Marseille-Q1083]|uniref:hypothetical protein n=1 Tax=Victivallis sp. Marseille-Q1083 TaxID=2717288 RepID=UPI00158BEA7C|nr:hypothetical protein [Victivallis sp. Marseille-Q1083]